MPSSPRDSKTIWTTDRRTIGKLLLLRAEGGPTDRSDDHLARSSTPELCGCFVAAEGAVVLFAGAEFGDVDLSGAALLRAGGVLQERYRRG